MQRDSLIDYYSDVECEKIILVHGDKNAKIALAQELENAISKKDKTSKVVCTSQGYTLTI
jgi:predicted metal-dependent RNase